MSKRSDAKGAKKFWRLVVLLASVLTASAAGNATLIDAAKSGNVQMVRTLLKQRLDVNGQEADGMTALHWAARNNDIETAQLLIRAGANVKAANRYGVTPITLAAENGNSAMVETLLKAGADANTALPEGETVLMTAARAGNADVSKSTDCPRRQRQRQGEVAGPNCPHVGGRRKSCQAPSRRSLRPAPT